MPFSLQNSEIAVANIHRDETERIYNECKFLILIIIN